MLFGDYSLIHEKCYAKLNLFLEITGLRPDNYHDLQSIFCKIDLYDNLTIAKSNEFSLKIFGEFAALIDVNNNLFTQIFEFFQKNFSLDSNLNIKLEKNIPIGAGLGGGSSNGASFIKNLNQIFNLNLSKDEMQKIGLNFGSDLPFFFESAPCLVEGRGEVLTDLSEISIDFANQFKKKLSQSRIILINPKINLATNKIFKNFANKIRQNSNHYSSKIDKKKLALLNFEEIFINSCNDLEESAFIEDLALLEISKNLQKFLPICARMSGSGSSFFAIFNDNENFINCLDFFNSQYPQYFIKEVCVIW